MDWIALQSALPVGGQFSLGGARGLVALLTAAVPGRLAMRARLARRRAPQAPRLVVVHSVSEPARRAARRGGRVRTRRLRRSADRTPATGEGPCSTCCSSMPTRWSGHATARPSRPQSCASTTGWRPICDRPASTEAAGRWSRPAAPPRARARRQDAGHRRAVRRNQGAVRRLLSGRAPDLDDAMAIASRIPTARNGSIEVRPLAILNP